MTEQKTKKPMSRSTAAVSGALIGGMGVVVLAQWFSEDVAGSMTLTLGALSAGAVAGGLIATVIAAKAAPPPDSGARP